MPQQRGPWWQQAAAMIRIFRRNDQSGGAESDDVARQAEVAILDQVRARHGTSAVSFGAPTRCPRCGVYGQVAGIDEGRGATDLCCPRCEERWTITRRALAFRPSTTGPVGDGVLIKQLLAESDPS